MEHAPSAEAPPAPESPRCAVCGSREVAPWFRTDFGTMGRCGGCGQVLRYDLPSSEAMVDLHRAGDLHETPYAELSGHASDELRFQDEFLDRCARRAERPRVLEVGAGAGEFLRRASERGCTVTGIEVVDELRAQCAAAVPGARLEERPLEEVELESGSFEGVAMWDVIEHLSDPGEGLRRVHDLLAPGGVLGVATLRHDSLLYGIYHGLRRALPPLARRYSGFLYNPFHTYYFTRQSLARLVESAGFTVETQRAYEFPIARLDVGAGLKLGLRGVYALQAMLGRQGEQYLFARK